MTTATNGTSRLSWFQRLELVCSGILFGAFNNITTILNAKVLFEEDRMAAGTLTIFFMLFPGVIISIGFLVLHWLGHRKIGRIPPFWVLIYFVLLFFFYPLVPIALAIYSLLTGKNFELAVLSKLFEGFLDDGPQFVLRLVIVVLVGVGNIGQNRDEFIFIMSMVFSFGALTYFGLKFNERKTNPLAKWLLALPMFAASVAARGFTLAVFLKETLDDKSEWIGGLIVLILYFITNVAIFKISGQDIIRSLVFGFSSTLIPAGYNNDDYYYQIPNQPLIDSNTYQENEVTPENIEMNQINNRVPANLDISQKMRSGLFLVLHTILNTILLSSCAIYIATTKDLSEQSNNALILPQILCVIPGCFFTLARSVLLEDLKPRMFHEKIWSVARIILACIFGLIAYGSLIPALFSSFIWKLSTTDFTELIDID